MKYFLISDPEGYNIYDLINLDEYKKETDEIIVLGDFIDSTMSFPNFSQDIFLEKKSFNLRNIREINKNENIRLIFGNRDLNKIKCLILNKLTNSVNSDIINKFNSGDIILSNKNYEDLKVKLLKNNENPWIAKLSNWYTFWNPNVGSQKQWNLNIDYSSNPFLVRFYEIFGIDNASQNGGTMSAQNLLETIPYEIGVKTTNQDYKAFIVLAIFNSLLSKNINLLSIDYNLDIKDKKENTDMNANFCKGWLSNIYLNSKNKVCDYIINDTEEFCKKCLMTKSQSKDLCEICKNNNKKILLLSHGGITKSIIKQENKLKMFKDNLRINNDLKTILLDATLFWSLMINKIGGYYNNDNDILSENIFDINNLIKQINSINLQFKQSIEACFYDRISSPVPSFNMLFLLIMSSPFDCMNFTKKITEINRPKCDGIDSSIQISPIMPGYETMRNEYFYVKEYNVYQIFGHQPVGYASTIDMFENNQNLQSFLINLDSSNSFTGSSINTGNSKSYLKLDLESSNQINLISSINHNLVQSLYDTNEIDYYMTQNNKTNRILFVVDSMNESNKSINIDNNICDTKFMNLLRKSNNFNFHGYIDDKIIFTVNSSATTIPDKFNKILFYINESELNTKGNFDSSSMKLKYLKYKTKYLNLQKQLMII